jgi:DNA-binding response OmpR family regulator
VATALQGRGVLVLESEPPIRNLLNLMEKLDGQDATDGEPLLAMLNDRQLDSVVLDLRWSDHMRKEEVRSVGKIRSGWVGTMLVLAAEISGPEAFDMLERYLSDGFQQALLWLTSHPCQSPH